MSSKRTESSADRTTSSPQTARRPDIPIRIISDENLKALGYLLSARFREVNQTLQTLTGDKQGAHRQLVQQDLDGIASCYAAVVVGPFDSPALTLAEALTYVDDSSEWSATPEEVEQAWQGAVKFHGKPAIDHRTMMFNGTLVDSREIFSLFLDQIVNDRLAIDNHLRRIEGRENDA